MGNGYFADASGTEMDDARGEPPWPDVSPEDDALISAVVNAHALGSRISEHHALQLLAMIGMDGDEADDLLTAAREEAGSP